jgi:hypothetical protein
MKLYNPPRLKLLIQPVNATISAIYFPFDACFEIEEEDGWNYVWGERTASLMVLRGLIRKMVHRHHS